MAQESKKIQELRAELAQLKVAQYVPPQTPEPPKPKVRQARTMKEYLDMVERERAQETSDAL